MTNWQEHFDKKSHNELSDFNYSGNALVVPVLPWLEVYRNNFTDKNLIRFYERILSKQMGEFNNIPQNLRKAVLEFTYTRLIVDGVILPIAKQGLLLYDDVFFLSENTSLIKIEPILFKKKQSSGNELVDIQTIINNPDLTESYEYSYPSLKLKREIINYQPDTIHLSYHPIFNVLTNIMSISDYRDKSLRKVGWTKVQNMNCLQDYNRSILEMSFLIDLANKNSNYSILTPPRFNHLLKKKTEVSCKEYKGGPLIELLFPNLDEIPWQDLQNICKDNNVVSLKKYLIETIDDSLNNDVDFTTISKILQPILNEFTNEFSRVNSPKKALVNLIISFLPIPYPFSILPNIIEYIKARKKNDMAMAFSKIRDLSVKHTTHKLI